MKSMLAVLSFSLFTGIVFASESEGKCFEVLYGEAIRTVGKKTYRRVPATQVCISAGESENYAYHLITLRNGGDLVDRLQSFEEEVLSNSEQCDICSRYNVNGVALTFDVKTTGTGSISIQDRKYHVKTVKE
jgi:hypothetical protein